MIKNWVERGVKFAMFGVAAIIVFGFLVRGLWNWLMPPLFGLHALTFAQAWGLLALSWILFGGLRGGGRPGGHWRRSFVERWEQMTPEEREKMRACFEARGVRLGAQPEPKS
jgi:Ca2+/H+ antiporter, TMEM165/GDT1 family